MEKDRAESYSTALRALAGGRSDEFLFALELAREPENGLSAATEIDAGSGSGASWFGFTPRAE